MNLSVNIGSLKLKNPVMTASGTFGYGREYSGFVDLNLLGAIVIKGLSLTPNEGNPPPRIVETPAGMLNAIGLQNIGIERFITEELPFLRGFETPIIVNFFGETEDEYVKATERLSSVEGIHALEMNISCPNKQEGWITFGTDPEVTSRLVGMVRKVTHLPLIVKLSPNVTDIKLMARVSEDAGADALSLINTITGMAIDIDTWRPKLANITGGLSGPAIRPVGVRMVWEVSRAVSLPLIGMGGIMNAGDAIEYMLAGATAVSVGTANFVNPSATVDIIRGMEEYMLKKRISDISDITGGFIWEPKGP